jgi:hypothetical protein
MYVLQALMALPFMTPLGAEPPQAGSAPPAATAVRDSYGLVAVEDGLMALGPDYKARFETGRMVFTPAFGERAERNFPLILSCDSAHRGRAPMRASPAARPEQEDLSVLYDHGDFVELYDVRREGIEQSFVFESLPEGTGDLVVRLAVAGELAGELIDGGRGGARFARAELGAVELGAVTGIDAAGASAPGLVRFVSDALELVLPADFVDGARLPLVVDPFIGGTFDIAGGSNDDHHADVAYDRDSDTYLAVWQRTFSIGDSDIRGRRFTMNGTLLGNVLPIEVGSAPALRPKVANVNTRDMFAVVWIEPDLLVPSRVVGATVTAALGGGAVGPKTIIDAPIAGAGDLNCDVGGEWGEVLDDVVVVFEQSGSGVLLREVQLEADGSMTPLVTSTVFANTSASWHSPAIAKSNGEYRYFLIVAKNSNQRIVAQAVNFSGVLVGSSKQVQQGTAWPVSNLDVDGNGRDFVVTWQREEPAFPGEYDVWGRAMTLDGIPSELQAGTKRLLAATPDLSETDPAVAFTGRSFTLAWIDEILPATDGVVRAANLDPVDLTVWGTSTEIPGGPVASVEIAGRYSGGAQVPLQAFDALVVWDGLFGADLDVRGGYFESPAATPYCTGKVNSCGAAASITFSGEASATALSGFAVRTHDARPGKAGLLIYSSNGRIALAFEGGTLCIGLPVRRAPAVFATGGTAGACDATLSIDMNCFASGLCGGNPHPALTTVGQVINCQWWGRDTVASGALLSNAMEYLVGP